MKKGNNVLLTIISLATLFIAVVGATFAYYTAILSEKEPDLETVNSGVIGMDFEGGPHINIGNIQPREEAWATKTFTVKGSSTESTTFPYTITLIINNNTFPADALTFTLTSETEENPNGTKAPAITTHTEVPITGSIPLGSGHFQGPTEEEKTHVYTLSIFLRPSGGNNTQHPGQVFEAHIDITPK